MEIHISNLIEIINPTKDILDFVTDTYVYNLIIFAEIINFIF